MRNETQGAQGAQGGNSRVPRSRHSGIDLVSAAEGSTDSDSFIGVNIWMRSGAVCRLSNTRLLTPEIHFYY